MVDFSPLSRSSSFDETTGRNESLVQPFESVSFGI